MRTSRSPALDTGLLLAVLALIAIGLPAIYSASHIVAGAGKLVRQLIWVTAGLVGTGVLAFLDYRMLARWRRVLLVLTTTGLLATLILARRVNGAQSWIDLGAFRLQPSEFAKLALILAYASLLARLGPRIRQGTRFLHTLLFFGLPTLLVLVQPDVGTAFILCAIWLAMTLLAGARWWMPASLCAAGGLLLVLAWNVHLPGGRALVEPYQKKRLDFIHADPAGSGYHQAQARIAIGAGQLWGKGYLHGTQARRGFLPEQDTDFIFAVIGEEFGLLGCLVVLGLYLFILFRLLRIAEEADTTFGRLITVGVATMLAVHVFVNVGMCLTLLPVTGVPLPFVSYGGSNVLTLLLALGIVLNISRHREPRRWVADDGLIRAPISSSS